MQVGECANALVNEVLEGAWKKEAGGEAAWAKWLAAEAAQRAKKEEAAAAATVRMEEEEETDA